MDLLTCAHNSIQTIQGVWRMHRLVRARSWVECVSIHHSIVRRRRPSKHVRCAVIVHGTRYRKRVRRVYRLDRVRLRAQSRPIVNRRRQQVVGSASGMCT